MKPQTVKLKLAGEWFSMPFVVDNTPSYLCFGAETQATNFTRKRASEIIRRVKSWGRYYRMVVVK
jgi:hypothetical protein